MSRRTNAIGSIAHDANGQVFHTCQGKVFGIPSTYKSEARVVANQLTGEITKLDSQVRIVIKVVDSKGMPVTLDPITFEQLSVATAKQFKTPKDLKCLRNADIMFYVSSRTQNEEYYYRPDQPATQKQLAQRTGEFTTLFGAMPSDVNMGVFDELADYEGVATQTEEQADAVKAEATAIKAKLDSGNSDAPFVPLSEDEYKALSPAEKTKYTRRKNAAEKGE